MDVGGEGVGTGNAADRAEARATRNRGVNRVHGIGHSAEIDVEPFSLDRPTAPQFAFDASTGGPSGLQRRIVEGAREGVDGSAKTVARASEAAAAVDVAVGQTAGAVEQHRADRVAQAAAHGAEPVDLLLIRG